MTLGACILVAIVIAAGLVVAVAALFSHDALALVAVAVVGLLAALAVVVIGLGDSLFRAVRDSLRRTRSITHGD